MRGESREVTAAAARPKYQRLCCDKYLVLRWRHFVGSFGKVNTGLKHLKDNSERNLISLDGAPYLR